MVAKRVALVAVLALAGLLHPPSAHAAFPGENGKIAFVSAGSIWTMNSDGSGRTQLNAAGHGPAWSPDGKRLAYYRSDGVHIVNADGGGDTLFVPNASEPAWAPTGDKLAVLVGSPDCPDMRVVRLDGSVEASYPGCDQETGLFCCYAGPAWRPNGDGIVRHWQELEVDPTTCEIGDPCPEVAGPPKTGQGFRGANANWNPNASEYAIETTDWGSYYEGAIQVLSADGSQIVRQLTASTSSDTDPAWSPDGSKIAFGRAGSIYVMDASGGSGVTSLGAGEDPDWQPIRRGYVRPRGATPVRIPLVPAYEQCTSPNSTHGAPLAFGSCNPPVAESSNLFVGIGDGAPSAAKSIGSVSVAAIVGAPGAPDDADVKLAMKISNVMRRSDSSDYMGELRLELPLRITDAFNQPSPSLYGPATVSDTSFFATVPCAGTSDTTIGATCSLIATADALVPGAVREGARSIWALDKIKVDDGGPDEDADTTGDNQLFEVQGVFVP